MGGALQPRRTVGQAPSGRATAAGAAVGTRHDQQPRARPSVGPATPLRPLIDDILRTRRCIPGSVFLVEDVQTSAMPGTHRWRALQLLLGDGRLCIQAILASQLHNLVQSGEMAIGSYVKLGQFTFGWRRLRPRPKTKAEQQKPKPPDGPKHGRTENHTPRYMVYLSIEDVVVVGRNDAYRRLWRSQVRAEAQPQPQELGNPSGVTASADPPKPSNKPPRPPVWTTPTKAKKPVRPTQGGAEVEKAFDDFDTLTLPLKISPRKPKKLPEPPQPVKLESPLGTPTKTSATPNQETLASPSKRAPVSLPRDWHHLQTPLRLTTLHSIPHLPFAQGWSCNVLAVIDSLSPVEPSLLPPHRQRTARLADPSTGKRVHLTVFLDPDTFSPAVGSAVLLVGVKNHPFDGGSLKKYASDGLTGAPATGTAWWFEDPWHLGWCDVAGIKEWWADAQRAA